MNKFILFILTALAVCATASVTRAQDREANNPTIEVSGHNVSIDFKLPRYTYQSSSQDWKESEFRPILGYGRFVYKGTNYVVMVISSSVSRYKYPNIKEGYESTSLNGYAIFTEEGFDEFFDVTEEEKIVTPVAYKSFAYMKFNEPFEFDKAKLFQLEKMIDEKSGIDYISHTLIEPSSVKFQVKRWKDVVRFNIPRNSNTAGQSETFGTTPDMEKGYYEIPYDDYIDYLKVIKTNTAPALKGSGKGKKRR